MSLGQSIRSGAKWLFLGNIGNRFLEFAFGVALARLLVPADFGMLITISVFTGFAGMVMSGGMGQSLIRAKTATEREFHAVFTMQMGLSAVIYGVFFFAAPFIADYFHNPLYADLLRVSALVFFIRPFALMRNAWLNREMDFKKRALAGVATGLVTGIAGVWMAWRGLGVWSLILSGLIGALVNNLLLAAAPHQGRGHIPRWRQVFDAVAVHRVVARHHPGVGRPHRRVSGEHCADTHRTTTEPGLRKNKSTSLQAKRSKPGTRQLAVPAPSSKKGGALWHTPC